MPKTRTRARLASSMALAAVPILLAACATPACGPYPGLPTHHAKGGFCNPPGSPEPTASGLAIARDGVRLAFARHRGAIPAEHIEDPQTARAALAAVAGRDHVSWLGHATLLIGIGGRTVLVDPVWSTYVTPVPPFGPKRITAPPIPLSDLPAIDVLLITHDHFDHLDLATLSELPNKATTQVVVPLGLGDTVRRRGFANVVEIDWWQSLDVAGLTLRSLPAQHQSGRSLLSKNTSLWTSYALLPKGEGPRIYLSGDTGYRDHFAAIGARFGPFDLAVLNVGGYGPRDVARAYHVTPSEAVQAVGELRADTAFPIHWGTYPLGAEPPFSPGPNFRAAADAAGLAPGTVRLMKIGETRLLGDDAEAFPAAPASGAVPGS